MIVLRLIHTAIWWLCNAAVVLLAGIVIPIAHPFDKKDRVIVFMADLWTKSMLWVAGVRMVVEGIENLREAGQCVLVCNHQSYFDIFVVIDILDKVPHFLAKKELFSIPVFGYLIRLGKVLEIDRQNPSVAVENIKRGLAEGFDRSVVIFPEGTRSPTGVMRPFRTKGISLLSVTGLPFVPAGICNTRGIMPKGSFMVRPGRIGVAIGKPIPPPPVSHEDPHQLEGFIEELWREVNLLQKRACELAGAALPSPE